jgi:hypothetical protein
MKRFLLNTAIILNLNSVAFAQENYAPPAIGANPTATAGSTVINGSSLNFMRSDAAPAIQKGSSSVFGLMECDNTTVTCTGGVLTALGSSSGANPTATAGPAAINGVATTFMRSDAAPLIQKGSSSQFGLMECDNSTITCTSGILTGIQPAGANPTATAGPTVINGVATTFMRSDGAPAIQKGSSSIFGLMECDNTTITCTSGILTGIQPAGANPTATAGPAAINGTATTFMRSDAAPLIQKGSSSQFGLAECDNTTISCSGGVFASLGVAGPGSAVSGNIDIYNGTTGKLIQDSGVAISGQASATLGVLSNHPGFVTASSFWYPAFVPGVTTATGALPVASSVYCTPFNIPTNGVTIKALGVDVTANDAGKFVAIAIFYDGTNGRPAGLLDYIPSLTLAGTGALAAAVHNTTDVLKSGIYWACVSTSSAITASFQGIATTDTELAFLLGSASVQGAVVANTTGISCTAASTCAGSYAVWSGSTFTWSTLASATWTLTTTTSLVPAVAFEVN